LGDRGIFALYQRIIGDVAHARERTDCHAAVACFDGVERQPAYIDGEVGRSGRFPPELQEIGASRDKCRSWRLCRDFERLALALGATIRKGLHLDPCHFADGSSYIGVGAATAQISAHQFSDGRLVGCLPAGEEINRGHNLSRRAVAALQRIMLNEGALQRVELIAFRKPFDCQDALAILHGCKRKARTNAPIIDKHRACATRAAVTPSLGASQMEILSQHIEKARMGWHRNGSFLAVNPEGDADFFGWDSGHAFAR
jgi:hypothetical protein